MPENDGCEPEAARAIIAHQIEILQALNDEAVRILRLQFFTLSVLVAGISAGIGTEIINVGQFWPPADLWDALGLVPLAAGTAIWGRGIVLIPSTHSKTKLGSVAGSEGKYVECIDSNTDLIIDTEVNVNRLYQLFAVGTLCFLIWIALLSS